MPNSSVWGAISSVLTTATRKPKTTRPTRPPGMVLGSVIMKNRKIMTSGEVTMTRQKSKPQTGANAQFAVMQWPGAASSPTPTASVTQNVAASASRCSRRVISRPPPMITDVGQRSSSGFVSGAHQKSSGSIRVLPSTMNATTSPMFDGLNTCVPRYLMTYFVSSENAATPANTYQRVGVPRVVGRGADDAQDQGHAAAGEHRARRPDERLARAEREGDLDDRGRQDRRQDLGHADAEVQPDLAEDVDRDDHRGDVQPRVADVRQDQRVAWCRRSTACVRAAGRPRRGPGSCGHDDPCGAWVRRILGFAARNGGYWLRPAAGTFPA